MSDLKPPESENTASEEKKVQKVTPLQCLTGATISGSLAYLLYLLTASITATFATKPLPTTNAFTMRIAAAVRSLVVSVVSLGTFVFGIVALGLFLLAIQVSLQTLRDKFSASP